MAPKFKINDIIESNQTQNGKYQRSWLSEKWLGKITLIDRVGTESYYYKMDLIYGGVKFTNVYRPESDLINHGFLTDMDAMQFDLLAS
jgi:hypothetical protein